MPVITRADDDSGTAAFSRTPHECDDAYYRQDQPEQRDWANHEERGKGKQQEDTGQEEKPETDPAGNVGGHACNVRDVGLLYERAPPLCAPAFCPGVEDDPGICNVQGAFAMCPRPQLHGRVLPQYALLVAETDWRPRKNWRTGRDW